MQVRGLFLGRVMPASEREQRRVAERRTRVLQLRADGATFEHIAAVCGHKTAAAAQIDFTRALADRKLQLTADSVGELFLPLELERLDGMERQVRSTLAQAADGDDPVDRALVLRCVDRLLRISERRTSLLRLDQLRPPGWAGPGVEHAEEREDAVASLTEARKRRRARAAARTAADPQG